MMSIQWTLIAGFLYAEIAVVLLLVLPVASPRRWNAIFKSRFLQALQRQAGVYFVILFGILVLFLLDAIREMRKYSNLEAEEHGHAHLDREMQGSMRLFRAQRNFYISGFALFLALVIRRLVILISSQAALLAQSTASMAQAQSATNAARELILTKNGEFLDKETMDRMAREMEIMKHDLKDAISRSMQEGNEKLRLEDKLADLAKDYDQLSDENSTLKDKLKMAGAGDKKNE